GEHSPVVGGRGEAGRLRRGQGRGRAARARRSHARLEGQARLHGAGADAVAADRRARRCLCARRRDVRDAGGQESHAQRTGRAGTPAALGAGGGGGPGARGGDDWRLERVAIARAGDRAAGAKADRDEGAAVAAAITLAAVTLAAVTVAVTVVAVTVAVERGRDTDAAPADAGASQASRARHPLRQRDPVGE